MNVHDIIIRPIVTERSALLMEENKYTFRVHKRANKVQIKKAVEEIFGVTVKKVNTMNIGGKKKRLGVHVGRTASWKKAIVTLTEDSKSIEIFEGI